MAPLCCGNKCWILAEKLFRGSKRLLALLIYALFCVGPPDKIPVNDFLVWKLFRRCEQFCEARFDLFSSWQRRHHICLLHFLISKLVSLIPKQAEINGSALKTRGPTAHLVCIQQTESESLTRMPPRAVPPPPPKLWLLFCFLSISLWEKTGWPGHPLKNRNLWYFHLLLWTKWDFSVSRKLIMVLTIACYDVLLTECEGCHQMRFVPNWQSEMFSTVCCTYTSLGVSPRGDADMSRIPSLNLSHGGSL